MIIERNYDNYEENEGGYRILPSGTYMFEIQQTEDKMSSNKDEMVKITFSCIDDDYYGTPVWDNILFPRPGSKSEKIIGRTKHFLHCIGEPFQGDFQVDTDNWQNKTVEIQVCKSEYENKSGNKKPKNDVVKYILNKELLNNTQAKNNNTSKHDLPWDNNSEDDDEDEYEEDERKNRESIYGKNNLPF